MRPTPSALKWLAEKRARTAGDLLKHEQLLVDVQRQVEELRRDLAALDHSIALCDQVLATAGIDAINGWAGTYGRRGALQAFVVETLEACAPESMSTDELAARTEAHFGLVFATRQLRARWLQNSLRAALHTLVRRGTLEAVHSPEERSMGRWRMKLERQPSLADLRKASEKATA